jgi:DNA polymerase I-like protein with 3'-5' exonuclease and polymerase domains
LDKIQDYICIDTETTMIEKNHVEGARLVQLGTCNSAAQYCSFVVDHVEQTAYHRFEWKGLKEWALTYTGLIVMHNALFDLCVLRVHGVTFPKAKIWDTMLGLKCINENETTLRLKTWATWLGFQPYADEFEQWMERGVPTYQMPLKMLEEYNEKDCRVTDALFQWEQEHMTNEQLGFFEFLMSMMPTVEKMANHGVKLDLEKLKTLTIDTWTRLTDLEERLIKKYGEINLNSPKQVSALLFDKLKLPDMNERSTNKVTMKKLEKRHSIITKLQERKSLETLNDKFLKPYEEKRIGDMLYGSWRVFGTESCRMTCKDPPLQTTPPIIRPCFVPKNGCFLWYDLDQIEYKLLSDIAGETKLLEAINRGEDVHKATAAFLFGVKYENVTDAMRKVAKTTNYAKVYGAGLGRLAETAGISYDKAKDFSQDYDHTFGHIAEYVRSVKSFVNQNGYVESPLGMRRTFPVEMSEINYDMRGAIERQAVDWIFQSMGHVILWATWGQVAKYYPELEWLLEYHDEVVADIPTEKEVYYAEGIKKKVLDNINEICYNQVNYKFAVHLTATLQTGKVWK